MTLKTSVSWHAKAKLKTGRFFEILSISRDACIVIFVRMNQFLFVYMHHRGPEEGTVVSRNVSRITDDIRSFWQAHTTTKTARALWKQRKSIQVYADCQEGFLNFWNTREDMPSTVSLRVHMPYSQEQNSKDTSHTESVMYIPYSDSHHVENIEDAIDKENT
jgi:hypothetical protein